MAPTPSAQPVTPVTPNDAQAAEGLMRMISGYWLSQAIHVVAKLNIAELLAAGPRTAEQLAQATGTHAGSLFRLLRAVASVGVLAQSQDDRFSLTALGELLRPDHPHSKHAVAVMMGDEHYACYGDLLETVRTGQTAFPRLHGKPIFDYLRDHPDKAANFDAAMVSIHGSETRAMWDAYNLGSIACLADIGGGNGSVIIEALTRFPHLRGILFDLPDVVARAESALAAAGVADRCERATGSFFETAPAADAYVMRHIIHDWDDQQCETILRTLRKAAPPQSVLLIVECVITPGDAPHFGKMLDLTMMLLPGGLERTEAQYRDLLERSGWTLTRIVPTESTVSILECHPV